MKTDITLQEMADMGSNYRYRQFIIPVDAGLNIELQERRLLC